MTANSGRAWSGAALVLLGTLMLGASAGAQNKPSVKFEVQRDYNLFTDAQNERGADEKRVFAPPGSTTFAVMLGSGNPIPNPNRMGPSVAIIVDETTYIVDAGEGVWRQAGAASLAHRGRISRALNPRNLNKLLLTHLHADHIIGLPALYLQPFDFFPNRTDRFSVFGPPHTRHLMDGLVSAFSYQTVLRADELRGTPNEKGWPVDVREYPEAGGVIIEDPGVRVEALRILHGNVPYAYSLKFITPSRTIVVSGDISGRSLKDPRVIDFYRGADVVIIEGTSRDTIANIPYYAAQIAKDGKADMNALAARVSYSHATTEEIAVFANAVKPKLLALYHMQNHSDPFDPNAMATEIRKYGYAGQIVTSRDLDVF